MLKQAEKCKIVTIEDLEQGGFELSVKKYLDKKTVEVVSPEEVRRNYKNALERVKEAEDQMRKALQAGGYIDE